MSDPLAIALRYLKFRPRTIFEVEQKLKTKKVPQKEITQVIQVLKRNKLLDDKNFAKMWIADRNLLKPTGSRLLRLELKKLGVPEEIIKDALLGQDEEALARKALETRSRLKNAEFAKKVGFLQRRGFPPSVIFKIIQ